MAFAQLLEQVISLGISLVAATLSVLSALAWRRERDRRMAVVTVGYALFALYGLMIYLEYPLAPSVPYLTLELVEHGSGVLILGGLVTFFIALMRE